MRYRVWFTWKSGQRTLIATTATRALALAVIECSMLSGENRSQYTIEDTRESHA